MTSPAARLRRPQLPVVVVLASLLVAAIVAGARRRARGLAVFAHRGFAAEAPENTVEAVRHAAPRADAVEVDVRRCGSGELVCVHDETLERVAGVPDRVTDVDWETLRTIDVGGGATIARLEDVLAVVPPDVLVNVECKERGLAADVVDLVTAHDGSVLVSSFDRAVLASVGAIDGTVPRAYVCRSPRRAVDVAAGLECVAIHPRADLPFRSLLVARAHRRGLAVNAWTIETRLEALALALAGVDGVFADRSTVGA